MYRVVIVDDEEPVLESFSFILAKGIDDFSLCGKARSGTEAVKLICEVKPDVVFMDIQMPGIDGIDAITQIRLHHPEIVFILATAYERFDVAQKAIPLGVFSYLVKPISRHALVEELHRVKVHLDRSRQQSSRELEDIRLLQKTKEEIKDKFLRGLAWGNPSEEDWEVFSRLYSLICERATIRLAEIPLTVSEEVRKTVFARLRENIQFKFNCLSSTIAGRVIFFFPEDQNLERLDAGITAVLTEFAPFGVAIGAGGIRHYSELSASFVEACHTLESSNADRDNYSSEREEMRHIRAAFLKSEFSRARSLFEDFSVRVFRDNEFLVAKGKMVALFTLLWNEMDCPTLSETGLNFDPGEAILGIRSVEEWLSWSSEMVESLQAALAKRDVRSFPQHLSKALAIIHEDYNRPIQLSTVADACQITANYLCRLFSEHLGISFVEYLTRYRIEQAMTLLRDNCLSVKEVSGLVGYQDPNYFSRIFRRYSGSSPSDLVNKGTQNDN